MNVIQQIHNLISSDKIHDVIIGFCVPSFNDGDCPNDPYIKGVFVSEPLFDGRNLFLYTDAVGTFSLRHGVHRETRIASCKSFRRGNHECEVSSVIGVIYDCECRDLITLLAHTDPLDTSNVRNLVRFDSNFRIDEDNLIFVSVRYGTVVVEIDGDYEIREQQSICKTGTISRLYAIPVHYNEFRRTNEFTHTENDITILRVKSTKGLEAYFVCNFADALLNLCGNWDLSFK